MKKNVLIVGAGSVAQVAAHKCAQHAEQLGQIHIASRRRHKCEKIMNGIHTKYPHVSHAFHTHQVNAMNVEEMKSLIKETDSDIVINLGPGFINQTTLLACIDTGAAYIDTSVHEEPDDISETPPWYANYEWKLRDRCEKNNITAILGAGFDPGLVNAYAKYAYQHCFDQIESLDILDVNVANHGLYFATNFDPEINLREFTRKVISWQQNNWVINEMFSIKKSYPFPVVGEQITYLTGHDEVHSISQNLKIPTVRFWMGFSDHYLNVFNVLKNLGLLSHLPVKTAEGIEIIPLKVVKAVLPDPGTLGPYYKGKTCIGDHIIGTHQGKRKELFIYNVADHEVCYQDVENQAIAYTAAVPAVSAALLIAEDIWHVKKMVNVEELPPVPFINKNAELGLKTWIRDEEGDREII